MSVLASLLLYQRVPYRRTVASLSLFIQDVKNMNVFVFSYILKMSGEEADE